MTVPSRNRGREPRTVLLTGASSGIGAVAAQRLARAGFRVFGTSRHARGEGDASVPAGIHWVQMNVCEDASVERGVAEVLAAVPRLDALVCNAGFGIFGSIEEVSIEAARAQFETNFFGVLRLLRAVLPHMRTAGSGRIAIVGSLSGRAPIPFQAHYSASKAAIDNLTLGLRNEVGSLGIGVSLIEPGDINTPFNEAMGWGDSAASAYTERLHRCEQVVRESLPKAPGPEVVARAIEHALTARRPRVRYPVGPDARLVPLARRLLPDWLSLALVRSHFKV